MSGDERRKEEKKSRRKFRSPEKKDDDVDDLPKRPSTAELCKLVDKHEILYLAQFFWRFVVPTLYEDGSEDSRQTLFDMAEAIFPLLPKMARLLCFDKNGPKEANACSLSECAKAGALKTAMWIACVNVCEYSLDEAKIALSESCRYGRDTFVEWLLTKYEPTWEEMTENNTSALVAYVFTCCKFGHIASAQAVANRMMLYARHSKESAHRWRDSDFLSSLGPKTKKRAHSCFVDCCADGQLAEAEWIADKFGIVESVCDKPISWHICFESYGDDNNGFFDTNILTTWPSMSLCCTNGHLLVAKWLCARFRLASVKFEQTGDVVPYAFVYACRNGHADVARWLCAHFNLTIEHVVSEVEQFTTASYAKRFPELHQWFAEKFETHVLADIYTILRQHKELPQGVCIRDICAAIPNATPLAIDVSLCHATNEGLVYTTIDEEHFKYVYE